MAYNADLLTKRGIQPPASDWTFDDFIGLATQAASTASADKSYGFLYDPQDDFLLAGRGVQWFDLEATPPFVVLNDSAMTSALSWLIDLDQSGTILLKRFDNWAEINRTVLSGQVAFWLALSGTPQGYFYDGGEPMFNVGVVPLPQMSDPNWMKYGSDNTAYYISSSADQPQICWDGVQFLSDRLIATKGVPARGSLAASAAWEASVGKERSDVYRQALVSVTPANEMPLYRPMSSPLHRWEKDAIITILQGNDLKVALDGLQKKADDYLMCLQSVDIAQLSWSEEIDKAGACAKEAEQ